MILNKIYEMTYKRNKVKDSIDDHVHQIVENWCLIWTAKHTGIHREIISHWINELISQIDPGLDKLDASSMSEKAQHKLIDEVLYSDAKLDQISIVSRMIGRKFGRENYSKDLVELSSEAWINDGLPKIRAIYRGELDLNDYGNSLKE